MMTYIGPGMALDRETREVVVYDGGLVRLSPKEFILFERLVVAGGGVVATRDLERELWRGRHCRWILKTLVNRLRERVGGEYVEVVRGVGYRFRRPAELRVIK